MNITRIKRVYAPADGAGAPPAAPLPGSGGAPAPQGAVAGASGAAQSGAAATGAAAPQSFADMLPADIREHAVFKDIKDLGALAKGYMHAQRLIGVDPAQMVRLPGQDDADAWNEVYTKLGRPEKPDGYKLPAAPEGLTEDPAFKSAFAEIAHKNGLSERQAASLVEWWNGTAQGVTQAQMQAREQAKEANLATLRTEFGTAFDERIADAKEALAHFGDAKLLRFLDETGLGDNPSLVKAFATFGKTLREDGIIGKDRQSGGTTPTEARQQINSLRADTAFMKAYQNKTDPGHTDALQRMQRLYDAAYPEG